MTRRGAHKGGYTWGGGGVDIGKDKYDAIMGDLIGAEIDLDKFKGRLSEWRSNPDKILVREALKAVYQIRLLAISTHRKAKRLKLNRATHLARKLEAAASYIYRQLSSIQRQVPQGPGAPPKVKLRLGGPSIREQSNNKG
jgi:hypothetical protein